MIQTVEVLSVTKNQPTHPVLTNVITMEHALCMLWLSDAPMKRPMVFVPLASPPEKSGSVSLIAAMLHRALEDVRAGGPLRTQALGWVRDLSAKARPGSFEWCCVALNLDVDAVRTRIVQQQSVEGGTTDKAVERS